MTTLHSNTGGFCDFETGYAGLCGMWIQEGDRCKKHEGKTSKPKRQKIGDYSGYSKHRDDHGEFQRR